MSFIETPPSIRWETIEGRKVPIITPECVVTLTHTETGKEYNSDAEAEADVNDPNTTDSVIGKNTINFPILPGHNPKGINAAIVVAVDIIIGNAISDIPFFVASILFRPSFSISL